MTRARPSVSPRRVGAASLAAAALGAAVMGCGVLGGPKPAWEQPPPPAKAAPIVAPGALTRVVLDNGLELMLLEDDRLPLVSVGLTFVRGTAIESQDQAGLAQFTAELMQRGAGDLDATALAERVDALGASLSVGASWDSMSVGLSGLSRDTDALLEILDDVARRPRFDAAEAESTRREQLASLRSQEDDPATLVGRRAMEVLYDGHRYGTPADGTLETVAKLDADAARAFHEKVFVPGGAIFYAVGDFDSGLMKERVAARFEGWRKGEVPAPVAPPPAVVPPPADGPARRRIVIADKPDLVQARIVLAHEGISRTDDRRIAAGLLNDVLGGSGFSARMMQELRSDEGLTYGVYSYFNMRRQPGPFVVSTFTRVPETRRAVDILLSQLEAIRTVRPVSEDELAHVKSYSVGQFALGLETSSAVIGALVDLELHGLPPDSLDTYRERVNAVTPAEVQALAKALLHPGRIAIVLLGPADALVPQFEDLGEIEVVKP